MNMVVQSSKVPQEVISTLKTIESGNLGNIKMNYENGNFEFSAESIDGKEKVIIKKHSIAGVNEESKISLQKPKNINERRERVLHFREKGLSQAKIAELTMTSQKTVSNDIRALKEQGKIKE